MQVNNQFLESGDKVYYTEAFRTMIEANLGRLRNSSQTTTHVVDPQYADVYEGDLMGYLLHLKVDLKYHWIYMRVNGMLSGEAFGPDFQSLLKPSHREIEQLKTQHQASTTLKD